MSITIQELVCETGLSMDACQAKPMAGHESAVESEQPTVDQNEPRDSARSHRGGEKDQGRMLNHLKPQDQNSRLETLVLSL